VWKMENGKGVNEMSSVCRSAVFGRTIKGGGGRHNTAAESLVEMRVCRRRVRAYHQCACRTLARPYSSLHSFIYSFIHSFIHSTYYISAAFAHITSIHLHPSYPHPTAPAAHTVHHPCGRGGMAPHQTHTHPSIHPSHPHPTAPAAHTGCRSCGRGDAGRWRR
jgi:hypothetical protein